MTPGGLYSFIPKLVASGLVVDTQAVRSSNLGQGQQRIEVGDVGPPTKYRVGYENSFEYYVNMVEEGKYSFMLFEGSLVSLSYVHENGTIKAHRFVYIPSVVDLDIDGGETVDYLPSPDDYLATPRRALLRFEYEPAIEKDRHPFSHLHINSPECRIPVSGPLSVKAFFFLVVDAFYPQFLAALLEELAPKTAAVSHISDGDMKRVLVKLPL